MLQVVLPAHAGRRRPVDMYLCGHHYRVSQEALRDRNASVFDVHGPVDVTALGIFAPVRSGPPAQTQPDPQQEG